MSDRHERGAMSRLDALGEADRAKAEALTAAMSAAQSDRDYATYHAIMFGDTMLRLDVAAGGYGVRTHPRQAEQLLRLDTVARRKRADSEAHTRGNLQGGNHSGNLRGAVTDLLRMVEQGREDDEMWAEGAARRHLEAENAAREATGRRVILYPPEMRRA